MNLPNSLTLTRIFLIPLLVVVLLTEFEGQLVLGLPKELVGAVIVGLAALTDLLDGYLARRRQQVTMLGQLMDPLADKLLVTAALVSLVQMGLAAAWVVAVILGRELGVTVLRSIAFSRGLTIAASPLGKFKMASQVVAIILLLTLSRGSLQPFFIVAQLAPLGGHGGRLGVGAGLLSPLQPRPDPQGGRLRRGGEAPGGAGGRRAAASAEPRRDHPRRRHPASSGSVSSPNRVTEGRWPLPQSR